MANSSNELNQGNSTSKLCRVLFASCISIAFIACDAVASSNAYVDTNVAQDHPIAGTLVGSWTHCANEGRSTTFVFDEYRFDQYFAYFEPNSGCSGEPLKQVGLLPYNSVYNSGTYELGESVETNEGLPVVHLDMTSDTLMGATIKSDFKRFNIVHVGEAGKLLFGTQASPLKDARPSRLDFNEKYQYSTI